MLDPFLQIRKKRISSRTRPRRLCRQLKSRRKQVTQKEGRGPRSLASSSSCADSGKGRLVETEKPALPARSSLTVADEGGKRGQGEQRNVEELFIWGFCMGKKGENTNDVSSS